MNANTFFLQISNNSRIVRDSQLKMKIHRFDLEQDTMALLRWVGRRLGDYATFTEPQGISPIVRTVGTGAFFLDSTSQLFVVFFSEVLFFMWQLVNNYNLVFTVLKYLQALLYCSSC